MGLFLLIDGPALVWGWVNFPIVWSHLSRKDQVEVTPAPGFCVLRFDHKVKIPYKHTFAILLTYNINPRAEKSATNSFTMAHESSGSERSSLSYGILNFTKIV